DNVHDHAFTASPSNPTPLPHNRLHSLVVGTVTRGGGKESYNRLHLRVIDYGFGLLSTLRPKLFGVEKRYIHTPGKMILSDLLHNRLPPFGHASNIFGYPEILSLVKEARGRVSITTPDDRAQRTLTVEAVFP